MRVVKLFTLTDDSSFLIYDKCQGLSMLAPCQYIWPCCRYCKLTWVGKLKFTVLKTDCLVSNVIEIDLNYKVLVNLISKEKKWNKSCKATIRIEFSFLKLIVSPLLVNGKCCKYRINRFQKKIIKIQNLYQHNQYNCFALTTVHGCLFSYSLIRQGIYKKRLLLRCMHHFKSDWINNMDYMRANKVGSKYGTWMSVKVSKQAEAKRDDVIKP